MRVNRSGQFGVTSAGIKRDLLPSRLPGHTRMHGALSWAGKTSGAQAKIVDSLTDLCGKATGETPGRPPSGFRRISNSQAPVVSFRQDRTCRHFPLQSPKTKQCINGSIAREREKEREGRDNGRAWISTLPIRKQRAAAASRRNVGIGATRSLRSSPVARHARTHTRSRRGDCVCDESARRNDIRRVSALVAPGRHAFYLVKIHLLMAKDVIACVTVPNTHTHTHTRRDVHAAEREK